MELKNFIVIIILQYYMYQIITQYISHLCNGIFDDISVKLGENLINKSIKSESIRMPSDLSFTAKALQALWGQTGKEWEEGQRLHGKV